MNDKIVGVIGGLGPESTVYFMKLVINYTKVEKDQDHINMLVSNHASTPDRTSYILDNNKQNPLPYMIKDAQMLEECGCSFLVMPCNTAHYLYDEIIKGIHIPFVNIIEETTKVCLEKNVNKVGLMATEGTIKSKVYQRYLNQNNIDVFEPNEFFQRKITSYIYDYVKQGKKVDLDDFNKTLDYFFDNCDVVIIGCTELSIIVEDYNLKSSRIVDSLTVLAKKTVLLANKQLKER